MNRDGGPIAAQSQLNPTPCQLSPLVASAGKQPRNRMQNHTCLQRRAGVRARGGNSGYGGGVRPIRTSLSLPENA